MRRTLGFLAALLGLGAWGAPGNVGGIVLPDLELHVVYLGPEKTSLTHYRNHIANDPACQARFGADWQYFRTALFHLPAGDAAPTLKAVDEVLKANLPGTHPERMYNKTVETDLFDATYAYSAFRRYQGKIVIEVWLS